jgi:D-alanyl-D-alanine dipeptidase
MWRARVADMEKKVAESEAKSAEANRNLSLALVTRKAEIDASQKFIKDQLGKVATQIDAQCKVDPKAVEILNQAARLGVKK